MVGWLTALLFTLVMLVTVKARSQEGFDAATPSGEALLNSVSPDYQNMIDAYSRAFMASKTTGDQTSLIQVRTAITEYQDQMREQVASNQFAIQTFLDDYKNMNPELDKLHQQAQVFKDEGPKVADQLAASTAETPTQIDYGALVSRIVVLVLIVGATLALNASSQP
jgi:hypothetical protein